mmetsp:Transcript_56262/g.163075  ORF Transcript_56262/g.163075 Transcript_56262/m.163075 type:complete len:288 (+) Transcript_56262:146-1009(+)
MVGRPVTEILLGFGPGSLPLTVLRRLCSFGDLELQRGPGAEQRGTPCAAVEVAVSVAQPAPAARAGALDRRGILCGARAMFREGRRGIDDIDSAVQWEHAHDGGVDFDAEQRPDEDGERRLPLGAVHPHAAAHGHPRVVRGEGVSLELREHWRRRLVRPAGETATVLGHDQLRDPQRLAHEVHHCRREYHLATQRDATARTDRGPSAPRPEQDLQLHVWRMHRRQRDFPRAHSGLRDERARRERDTRAHVQRHRNRLRRLLLVRARPKVARPSHVLLRQPRLRVEPA